MKRIISGVLLLVMIMISATNTWACINDSTMKSQRANTVASTIDNGIIDDSKLLKLEEHKNEFNIQSTPSSKYLKTVTNYHYHPGKRTYYPKGFNYAFVKG